MSSGNHPSQPLRVAAIGLGWVTTHRHLPTMESQPDRFQLVGCVDRRPGLAKQVAAQRGYARHAETNRLADVPWLSEVDAVTIGTSPFTHHALAKEALQLGKHVLTEKPFCLEVHEGEELVALARELKKTLAIVHNFQFAPSTKKLLADLAGGENSRLGTVRAVVAKQLGNPRRRLPDWYEKLPLGLFYDESPHMMYLMAMLAPGPMKLVQSTTIPSTTNTVTPACIDALYTARDAQGRDIPVQLVMHFEAPLSEWHLTVMGDKGMGIIDIFRDIYVFLPNDEKHTSWPVLRTSLLGAWQHFAAHVPNGVGHFRGSLRYGNDEVFKRFGDAALAGGGTEPQAVGPEDALRVLKMQHEIIRAAGGIGATQPAEEALVTG